MIKCVKELSVGERVVRKNCIFIIQQVSRGKRGLYKITLKNDGGTVDVLSNLPEGITLEVCE